MTPRADYGARLTESSGGGVVATVATGGPADRAGVAVGDTVVLVEGHAVRDVIDWQWFADGPRASIQLRGADSVMRDMLLERDPGESWGLTFTQTVFDGVRTCRNRCAFCFMTQLPKGLRRALYLRDDDYRLSFLQGNFVTLTNLSDDDVARIGEQHLSPLYVSLHSVDPDVRARLVSASEDRALARFDELLDAGIDFHVQIVLVPTVNDGAVLDETLAWLAEREGVLSVGVVPLGFTAHQERFDASYGRPEAARAVIAQVAPWQHAFRERDGVTWVYLADEFYLNAGRGVPSAAHYDGYPQYENGIGLVRAFMDEASALQAQLAEAIASLPDGVRLTLATGCLFGPTLDELLGAVDPRAKVTVLPIRNDFFGGNVSVTGLLTAADLVPAIAAQPAGQVILVPSVVVNADGVLLDDVAASELAERSGRDVRLVSCDAGGLLQAIRDVAADPPPMKE